MEEKKSDDEINLENLRLHSNGLTSNLHSTLPLSREIVNIELWPRDQPYYFDIFLIYKLNDHIDKVAVGNGNISPREESYVSLNSKRDLPYSPQISMQLPGIFKKFGYKIRKL
mgnify:CR=1 FL=1